MTGLLNFCKFYCSKCLQKQGSVSRVWVWIWVQFLEDAIYSLQPKMVGGTTQRWINTKIQFCCSYSLKTYHRIYLWVISVGFLHFQSLLRFMRSQFGYEEPMWLSLLMQSSFLKIRFLIKSEIYMLISSQYCVSHKLWLMSQLLPYCCLKHTVERILTDCLMCVTDNDDISKRVNILSKFLFIYFTKLIFKVTLCQVCLKLNTY